MADENKTVGSICQPDSRFFLKSEWAPISDYWPALSFSKRSVGDYLCERYRPDRDFIVYAGTSDASRTRNLEHRKCLLSVIITEPGQPIPTEDLVPWDSWQKALKDHDKAWPFSFGVRRAWGIDSLPRASNIVPEAYSSLGYIKNRGGVVEVVGPECEALRALRISEVALPKREVTDRVSAERDKLRNWTQNKELNQAIVRMESLIRGRIGPPGRTSTRVLQPRILPHGTNLLALLAEKLFEQNQRCALCGQRIPLDGNKKLLQCSPDRIDSRNPSYGKDNLQITHLACNLAKNDGTTSDFEEWLEVVNGDGIPGS